jgi:hypothetical protein
MNQKKSFLLKKTIPKLKLQKHKKMHRKTPLKSKSQLMDLLATIEVNSNNNMLAIQVTSLLTTTQIIPSTIINKPKEAIDKDFQVDTRVSMEHIRGGMGPQSPRRRDSSNQSR